MVKDPGEHNISHQSSESIVSDPDSLADSIGFELLGEDLGKDVRSAIEEALAGGAIFLGGDDPLSIFRQTLATSIRDIRSHPRGRLLQEFLLKGPYEDVGEIPGNLINQRISDADTAAAITFIFSFVINSFKGALTEFLAAKACSRILSKLKTDGDLHPGTKLYVGDSVLIRRGRGRGLLKGADLHFLVLKQGAQKKPGITVAGIAEVKSYRPSEIRLRKQLDRHLERVKRGIRVGTFDYRSDEITLGYRSGSRIIKITAVPSNWKLSRSFRFEDNKLHVDSSSPPRLNDEIIDIGDGEWKITLRWSREALAKAAFNMTFWYMGKIGDVIYSESLPKGWNGMSPPDAGRNAAKMMLYYALLRCRGRDEQRAIALYNSYCFGYAIGMNYKNAEGRREMLWLEDLEEILATGKTKNGCTIH